jgi:hypothetical protein
VRSVHGFLTRSPRTSQADKECIYDKQSHGVDKESGAYMHVYSTTPRSRSCPALLAQSWFRGSLTHPISNPVVPPKRPSDRLTSARTRDAN